MGSHKLQGKLPPLISRGLKMPRQLDCFLLTATITVVSDTDFLVGLPLNCFGQMQQSVI